MKIKPIELMTTKDTGFGKKPYKLSADETASPLTVGGRIYLSEENKRLSLSLMIDSGLAFPLLISYSTYRKLNSPKLNNQKEANLITGEKVTIASFQAMITIGEISFDTNVYVNPNKDFDIDLLGSPIFNMFSIYIGKDCNMIMPRMDKLITLE